MKKLIAVTMLLISSSALADVSARDIQNADRELARACNSGSNSACANAGRQRQAVSQQLNQELAATLTRTPDENRRRNQVIQEEKWREESRRH